MKSICQQQQKLEEPAAVSRFHLYQVANQSISCFFTALERKPKIRSSKSDREKQPAVTWNGRLQRLH